MPDIILGLLTNGKLIRTFGILIIGVIFVCGLYFAWRWYTRNRRALFGIITPPKITQNSGTIGSIHDSAHDRTQNRIARVSLERRIDRLEKQARIPNIAVLQALAHPRKIMPELLSGSCSSSDSVCRVVSDPVVISETPSETPSETATSSETSTSSERIVVD